MAANINIESTNPPSGIKQKPMKHIFPLLVIGLVILTLAYGDRVFFKNQSLEINVNDTYLFSFDWDEDNPFEHIQIDTVTVLDIKDGYVKYKYRRYELAEWDSSYFPIDFTHSIPTKFFKHNIREIK